MADNAPQDSSLQSTKQMLDELDALMERMLSMPMSEPEDAAPLPTEAGKGPTLAASLTLLGRTPPPGGAPSGGPAATPNSAPVKVAAAPKKALEARGRAPSPTHLPVKPPHLTTFPSKLGAPQSSQGAAAPLAESVEEALPAWSPGEPELLTNEVLPPTVLPQLDPLLAQVPMSSAGVSAHSGASLLSWVFAPLLWINELFDQATMFLGPVGARLRSKGGRLVLGFAGIGFFLAAVGSILKDLLGWN